jgi:periplasmic divalent cation tolerance protein
MKISIFYIPTGSAEEAQQLGQKVVENKLAVCSNSFPIQSIYPWEGKIQSDNEFVLILKTFPDHNETLQTFIVEHHSYKIPCILHWDAEVNEAYYQWMKDVLRTN